MRNLAALIPLTLPTLSQADDKLVAHSAHRHPDVKHFDPAAEGLCQEVQARETTPDEAKRMLAAARAHVGPQVGPFAPVPAGWSFGGYPKRMARMQRAARRRIMVAGMDASAKMYAWQFVTFQHARATQFVPHY